MMQTISTISNVKVDSHVSDFKKTAFVCCDPYPRTHPLELKC